MMPQTHRATQPFAPASAGVRLRSRIGRLVTWRTLLIVLACGVLAPRPAAAEHRLALVIGNAQYENVVSLHNTLADANAMRHQLEATGFEVIFRENVDRRAMNRAVDEFVGKLSSDTVALLYFAGHGVQIGATNYLLPTDIRAETANDIASDAIDLTRVLERVTETQARFSLAIIDACRDNPFRVAGRSLGMARGLAPSTSADGVMVVYSAGANQTALDSLSDTDASPNGVFTREWLRTMSTPGLSVQEVAVQVRQSVASLAKTVGHVQTPAVYDQSTGTFAFVPGTGATAASSPAPAPGAVPSAAPSAALGTALAGSSLALASPPQVLPATPVPIPAAPPRAAPAVSGPAPAQSCDRLGQPPRRMLGRETAYAEGIPADLLDGPAARAACTRAMRDWPNEPRFAAYAARAADATGDDREAARLYRIAADAGSAIAQNNLGTLYETGKGVARDLREAFRLYKAAADQGYPRAFSNLGEMYVSGRAGVHDEREAVRLFMVGVEQDDDSARTNLGVMYAEGRGGLARNTAEAARLWRVSAERGDATAQKNLRRVSGR